MCTRLRTCTYIISVHTYSLNEALTGNLCSVCLILELVFGCKGNNAERILYRKHAYCSGVYMFSDTKALPPF